jgi:hypothetical protein
MVEEFQKYPVGKFDTAERRRLLTVWTGNAYRQMEEEREKREAACALDPQAPRSLFYRAFLRTGCLITSDGTGDDQILLNRGVSPAQLASFHNHLRTPAALQREAAADAVRDNNFIIELETDSEEIGDSEDIDDESAEGNSDDDGEREPVFGNMVLEVDDEKAQLRVARNRVIENGNEIELADFALARRIADQFGPAPPTRSGRKRRAPASFGQR